MTVSIENSTALKWVMERFNGKIFKCGNHTKIYWSLRKQLGDSFDYAPADKYPFITALEGDELIFLKYNDYEFVVEKV